jgi:hypothetical protein
MAVTTTNVFSQYTATGASNTFSIGFYLQTAGWLTVKVDGVVTTSFTSVINTDQDTTPGGTITINLPLLTAGQVVRIERHTPITQLDVYSPYTPFPAQTVEFDFDKAICVCQELAYSLSLIVFPPIGPATAGLFLSNDGTVLLWAPVSGGGGGGISVIGPVTTPTANAAIITGLSNNILELAVADATHPGITSIAAQTFGGLKTFADTAIVEEFDVRRFGAKPLPPGSTPTVASGYDCSPAIEATIASGIQTMPMAGRPGRGAYFPGGFGNYIISRPIQPLTASVLWGDDWNISNIQVGPGDSLDTSVVQGFAGPMVFFQGPPLASYAAPNFTTSLASGPGNALTFSSADFGTTVKASTFWLHDCWAWGKWLNRSRFFPNPSTLGLRFFFQFVTNDPGRGRFIMGTHGSSQPNSDDTGIAVWEVPDDATGGVKLQAYLTTEDSGQQNIIMSSDMMNGSIYYVELSYDGANFRFYVNGVHQGFHAMTGAVYKVGWEGASVGSAPPEYEYLRNPPPIGCSIDSISLTNAAIHTGTGSYTPPTTKHTWDSNTVWLCNFDKQSLLPPNQVYLVAQTRKDPGTSLGWIPHFCRLEVVIGSCDSARNGHIRDLSFLGNFNAGGVAARQSDHIRIDHTLWQNLTGYGVNIFEANSFYFQLEDTFINAVVGEGVTATGSVLRTFTQGCAIGIHMIAGVVRSANDQPGTDNFISHWYGGLGGSFYFFDVSDSSNDEEGTFLLQRYPIYMDLGGTGGATFTGNTWSSGSTNNVSVPAVIYSGIPYNGATHIGDAFYTSPYYSDLTHSQAISRIQEFTGYVTLINCSFPYSAVSTPQDTSIYVGGAGWVNIWNQGSFTNQIGLSITDSQAYNLTGTTFVLHGQTVGRVVFPNPEIDGNYTINLTPSVSFNVSGGGPATGSNRVVSITKTAAGFTFTVEADPGGSNIQYFDWQLIRFTGIAETYVYVPAISSSVGNPEAGKSDWAMGVSLLPAANNIIPQDGTLNETVLQFGSPANSANWAEIHLFGGNQLGVNWAAGGQTLSYFVDSSNRLGTIMSPGVHNVAIGANLNGQKFVSIDGAQYSFSDLVDKPLAQSPTYFGQRYDGSQIMTLATGRNEKLGKTIPGVITYEPDSGPGVMTHCVIFGDEFTVGYGAVTTAGSYASQIAGARYGSSFYDIVADIYRSGALGSYADPNHPSTTVPGLYTRAFLNWGVNQTLSTVVVQLGFCDILYYNQTATTIWATMLPMLEGAKAAAEWITCDRNDNAFGFFVPPTSGSASVTIGVAGGGPVYPFTVTFNTSIHQTNLDFAAAINATSGLNTLIYATQFQQPPQSTPLAIWNNRYFSGSNGTGGFDGVVIVTLRPHQGALGDYYITTLTDGANGASWTGWTSTQTGNNSVAIIEGVNFDADPFGGSVAATTANIVSQINGSSVASAVTASSVSGGTRVKVEANTVGSAGNSISVSGNNIWPPTNPGFFGWDLPLSQPFAQRHLIGGVTGILQTGATNIVVCNVPPMGNSTAYTTAKNTERLALNTLISNWVTANAGSGAVLADFDVTLRDSSAHNNLNPAYLTGDHYINDAGQTALYTLMNPLLP